MSGDVQTLETITEEKQIKQILYCIGFSNHNQRNAVFDDSFWLCTDFSEMNESDIAGLTKE